MSHANNKPVTRKVGRAKQAALRELFTSRGHSLAKNAKNKYLAFEVRTDAKSIFSFYTSGKLVSTVREGDGEGLLLEDELARLLGAAAGAGDGNGDGDGSPGKTRVTKSGPGANTRVLAGVDETGTGELIGTAILGGAWCPVGLHDTLDALVGHVETKTSRAASGWERLGQGLSALRSEGLVLAALPIPNRLFDRYSKNALLDLAYVRLVGDLIAGGAEPDEALDGVELAVDDYGVGALLKQAIGQWAERGIEVKVETKADDRYLAARAASVLARATRAREMAGIHGDVEDGPIGTGNAGHPQTIAWLKRRARGPLGWPTYVKTSFRTVSDIDRVEAVRKEAVPPPGDLLDAASAADFLAGRLDVRTAKLRTGASRHAQALSLPARRTSDRASTTDFLPLLCGGVVLDRASIPLELLDTLVEREAGQVAGWRVLVGPSLDTDDPFDLALARAHARGIVHLVPTDLEDDTQRAVRHVGLRVFGAAADVDGLHVILKSD